jgi:hypothetical protein
MSGRQFAREIFSAFWSGKQDHAVATLVYFPAWAKDSEFLDFLMKKTPSYEASRWAVDSAVANLQERIYADHTYVTPYANLLIHSASLFKPYAHPSKDLHVYILEGRWVDSSSRYDRIYDDRRYSSKAFEDRGEPWEACWRYRKYEAFWQRHGDSLPFAAVLAVVRETPQVIGTVRRYMCPQHNDLLRRSVRAFYKSLPNMQAALIYRAYPEAVVGLPVPLTIQQEQARAIILRGDVDELKTAEASRQLDVLSIGDVMTCLAPSQVYRDGKALKGKALVGILDVFLKAGWDFQTDHVKRFLSSLNNTERSAFLGEVLTHDVLLPFSDVDFIKGSLRVLQGGSFSDSAAIRNEFLFAGYLLCLHRRDRKRKLTQGLIKAYEDYASFAILLSIGTEPLADHASVLDAKDRVEKITEEFIVSYMRKREDERGIQEAEMRLRAMREREIAVALGARRADLMREAQEKAQAEHDEITAHIRDEMEGFIVEDDGDEGSNEGSNHEDGSLQGWTSDGESRRESGDYTVGDIGDDLDSCGSDSSESEGGSEGGGSEGYDTDEDLRNLQDDGDEDEGDATREGGSQQPQKRRYLVLSDDDEPEPRTLPVKRRLIVISDDEEGPSSSTPQPPTSTLQRADKTASLTFWPRTKTRASRVDGKSL